MKQRKPISIILTVVLAFTALCSTTTLASSNPTANVVIDGEPQTFDVPAQIIDGRTMVPFRAIFEKLGAGVIWDPATLTIKAQTEYVNVEMLYGDNKARVNTTTYYMYAPPKMIDGRTMVSVRDIANILSAETEWDDSTKTVYITSPTIETVPWEKKTGYGSLFNEFDEVYYGPVVNHIPHGYGQLRDAIVGVITGEGLFDGEQTDGSRYFTDGSYFTGTYRDDYPFYGQIYYPGSAYYSGSIPSMFHHGEGTHWYADGSHLTGTFGQNGAYGDCTFYSADSGLYYYGTFAESVPNGYVVVTDSDYNYICTEKYEMGEFIERY